jgi:uncharacterized protein involved in oxidation of intracellular sulfur
MMTYLIILNYAPYGTEHSYNALRLASSLAKEGQVVSIFLMADAASCAVKGQITPTGYYNIERQLSYLETKNCPIGVCGTCMDARGITQEMLVKGAHRSTMIELTQWTVDADKVISF